MTVLSIHGTVGFHMTSESNFRIDENRALCTIEKSRIALRNADSLSNFYNLFPELTNFRYTPTCDSS